MSKIALPASCKSLDLGSLPWASHQQIGFQIHWYTDQEWSILDGKQELTGVNLREIVAPDLIMPHITPEFLMCPAQNFFQGHLQCTASWECGLVSLSRLPKTPFSQDKYPPSSFENGLCWQVRGRLQSLWSRWLSSLLSHGLQAPNEGHPWRESRCTSGVSCQQKIYSAAHGRRASPSQPFSYSPELAASLKTKNTSRFHWSIP